MQHICCFTFYFHFGSLTGIGHIVARWCGKEMTSAAVTVPPPRHKVVLRYLRDKFLHLYTISTNGVELIDNFLRNAFGNAELAGSYTLWRFTPRLDGQVG